MNLMVSLFAGIGIATWVYTKIMRSTGGNNQNSLIVAGSAGLGAFTVMMIIMSKLPQ